jgi:hypothetical protein
MFLAISVLIGPLILDDLNAADSNRALLHLRDGRHPEPHLR